jgi:hypothetical protein
MTRGYLFTAEAQRFLIMEDGGWGMEQRYYALSRGTAILHPRSSAFSASLRLCGEI